MNEGKNLALLWQLIDTALELGGYEKKSAAVAKLFTVNPRTAAKLLENGHYRTREGNQDGKFRNGFGVAVTKAAEAIFAARGGELWKSLCRQIPNAAPYDTSEAWLELAGLGESLSPTSGHRHVQSLVSTRDIVREIEERLSDGNAHPVRAHVLFHPMFCDDLKFPDQSVKREGSLKACFSTLMLDLLISSIDPRWKLHCSLSGNVLDSLHALETREVDIVFGCPRTVAFRKRARLCGADILNINISTPLWMTGPLARFCDWDEFSNPTEDAKHEAIFVEHSATEDYLTGVLRNNIPKPLSAAIGGEPEHYDAFIKDLLAKFDSLHPLQAMFVTEVEFMEMMRRKKAERPSRASTYEVGWGIALQTDATFFPMVSAALDELFAKSAELMGKTYAALIGNSIKQMLDADLTRYLKDHGCPRTWQLDGPYVSARSGDGATKLAERRFWSAFAQYFPSRLNENYWKNLKDRKLLEVFPAWKQIEFENAGQSQTDL